MRKFIKPYSRVLMAVMLPVAGSALSAELPVSLYLKLGSGAQSGGLQETSDRGNQFSVAGAVEYKLTEKGSIVGELGWRYMPGKERIASFYKEQIVNVPVTDPRYYQWETGQVMRNEAFNIRTHGLQFGVLYSHELQYDFYVFGGLRLNFFDTREMVFGSEIVAGTRPAAANAFTPVAKSTDIGGTFDKSIVSPGAAAGIGYSFLEIHAVEFSVTTAGVETARFGKKSGVLVDFTYRWKF